MVAKIHLKIGLEMSEKYTCAPILRMSDSICAGTDFGKWQDTHELSKALVRDILKLGDDRHALTWCLGKQSGDRNPPADFDE